MLELLSERLVVRLPRDAFEHDAQSERRKVLDEITRTAPPAWRRFLERHAHRVQRGGLPMALALGEAEPASSEIGAAVRAYLAQHPAARPSLVAATRCGWDACVRTLEPLPRVVLECANLAHGETVAYAGGAGALHRFDLATGEVRSGESSEDASPRWLVVAPGAGPIITASENGAIHLWDRETLAAKKTGRVRGEVFGMALSPDGRQLACATDQGLQLGDRIGRGLKTVMRDKCTSAPAFDATGARIAVVAFDGSIRIADVASGKPGRRLAATPHRIEAVAFLPDGRLLASSEGGLEVWDPVAGTRLATLTVPRRGARAVSGVDHIAISADGRTALTGGASDDVIVWDLERGVARGALVTGTLGALGMFLLPDGHVATIEQGAARLWSIADFDAEPAPRRHVGNIAFVGDTRLVASDSHEVRLHDLTDLAAIAHIEAPPLRAGLDRVHVAVSPEGRHVATWTADELVVRDTATLAETWRLTTRPATLEEESGDLDDHNHEDAWEDRSIRAVVFAGPHLAIATAHEAAVRLVRVDGAPVAMLAGHHQGPDELVVADDGTVVSRAAAHVIAWKLDDGQPTIALRRTITAAYNGVVATAVSPDAMRYAAEGGFGFTITDLATGAATHQPEKHWPRGEALAFTPDGRTLVGIINRELRIRDASTGALRASKSDPEVQAMRVLPDGKHVLAWSDDTLSLYGTETGEELARWIAAAPIHDLAVAPSGTLVAISTKVGSLELVRWHPGTPALVVRVDPPARNDRVEDEDIHREVDEMFAADMSGLPSDRVERLRALIARADDARPMQEREYLTAAAKLLGELRESVPAEGYADFQRELGRALVWTTDRKLGKQGVALLRESIDAGNRDAMYALGYELFYGDYLTARPKEGLALIERAAEREHPLALHFIGMEYFENPSTRARALELVTRAAELDVADARTQLADWAVEGAFGPKDPQRAFALYSEVADRDCCAVAGIAILYKHGLGVAQDGGLAAQWYERAKKAGYDWSEDKRW